MQALKVDTNKRFLVREDGTPVWGLEDTVWELLHESAREELEYSLVDLDGSRLFSLVHSLCSACLYNAFRHAAEIGVRPDQPRFGENRLGDQIQVVQAVKAYVLRHYMHKLHVSGIAKAVHLTPNYVSKLFRRMTGQTLTAYITSVRMEAAKKLLAEEDLKVLQVAELVGFDDPHYFSKVFKKYHQLHPIQYKRIRHRTS